jgi:hypothetical protein
VKLFRADIVECRRELGGLDRGGATVAVARQPPFPFKALIHFYSKPPRQTNTSLPDETVDLTKENGEVFNSAEAEVLLWWEVLTDSPLAGSRLMENHAFNICHFNKQRCLNA